MRLHIRSCEALLEKGVSLKDSDYQSNYHFRKTGMNPAPKKKEDDEDNEGSDDGQVEELNEENSESEDMTDDSFDAKVVNEEENS